MGALSDMGIHKVDLIQYLLGQKVIETTAKVVTLNKRDDNGKLISVDDNALCILKMSGGALGTMAASWTVYGHECQSTVLYGTKGLMMIYSEPSAPSSSMTWRATAPASPSRQRPTTPASSTSLWTRWSMTGSRRCPARRL